MSSLTNSFIKLKLVTAKMKTSLNTITTVRKLLLAYISVMVPDRPIVTITDG